MSERLGRLVREPPTGTVRQRWGTLGPNEIRVEQRTAERLVDALSVDHASSFNLFYLLRKHYWTAAGAEQEDVSDFLEDAYKRVRDLTDDLAVRIVQLGGIPPNTPPTIQERARVHLEAEDVFDLRSSLEGDLEAYGTIIADMREHVELADRLGDQASVELLSDHLETLENDAEQVEKFLEDDALVQRARPPVTRTDRQADSGTQQPSAGAKPTHLRRPGSSHRRQRWDTVEQTELRLERSTAEGLVDAMNDELSGLYILYNQLRKHAWCVEGSGSNQLRNLFEANTARLTEMTDDIGIRVVALGGVPVSGPMGLRQHATMYIEAANHYDVRSSLERDLEGYATLAEEFRDHVELANASGDEATSDLLAGHLFTLERDLDALDKFLADDTLVRP
ncbi:DNA starvation/stationary phase protection protein DpsA [Haloarchaeobius sp. DFWS5]|uniref:DNA starvation/stationary phase protection protein DpsA n=1 Tax=Haloarchaeobius sp. DFWS5 TaxID=3446114 RepID=UPI003EBC9411